MPNRILRDWTDSEVVNSLNWQAEVVFTRLIMKVDDYGRFPANSRLLRSLLFPLRDGLRDADITRCLAECEKAGLIAIYHIEGKSYLEIRNFKQRIRNEKSHYPEPGKSNGSSLIVNCQSNARLGGGVFEDGDVCGDEVVVVKVQPTTTDDRPPPNEPIGDEEWIGMLKQRYPDRNVEGELKAFQNHCQRKGTAANRNGFVGWLKKASPAIREPKPRYSF